MVNIILTILLSTTIHLSLSSQRELQTGTYFINRETSFEIIKIENDSMFTYIEYYNPKKHKLKAQIQNLTKKSGVREVTSGSGIFYINNSNLLLKFKVYDTHGNQNSFPYHREKLALPTSELRKL